MGRTRSGPSDAVLFGAVGDPGVEESVSISGLILPLRRRFDLFVNLRPNVLYPGVTSPLRNMEAGDIDMAVVRENTEGEYADVGGFQYHGMDDEVAIQTGVFTRRGIERVVRYAFELAQRRDRKKVTSVTKSNAQRYSMTLWDRVFRDVAADYPDIETQSLLVDAAAMDFVRRPETFDVVVASNLFADILTDLAAAITGSIGLAASANIDPTRRNPSVFEPIHGSAPRHRREGHRQPPGDAAVRRHDAGPPGRTRCRLRTERRREGRPLPGRNSHAGPRRKGNRRWKSGDAAAAAVAA